LRLLTATLLQYLSFVDHRAHLTNPGALASIAHPEYGSWAAFGPRQIPKMLKASHKRPKAFDQLVVPIQYGSKMLETLRSDLSRR
jgi:hypothetical protein